MSDAFADAGADPDDMTTARPPQPRVGRHRTGAAAAHASFDDAAVERLLRGDWVDGPVAARLARIFDAAAAPATPDELRHADAEIGRAHV